MGLQGLFQGELYLFFATAPSYTESLCSESVWLYSLCSFERYATTPPFKSWLVTIHDVISFNYVINPTQFKLHRQISQPENKPHDNHGNTIRVTVTAQLECAQPPCYFSLTQQSTKPCNLISILPFIFCIPYRRKYSFCYQDCVKPFTFWNDLWDLTFQRNKKPGWEELFLEMCVAFACRSLKIRGACSFNSNGITRLQGREFR
jgi:hypothetical protein